MSYETTNLFYMWDYPTVNEILTANVGKVSDWVDRQLRSFMASRKKLADIYRESQDLASRLVEESFPSAPKLGPPIGKPDNDTSNGSIVVGAVTAGALLLMSPVLGPISLLDGSRYPADLVDELGITKQSVGCNCDRHMTARERLGFESSILRHFP
jgi:hypothetical protein